jgi:hypothetical protein
MKKDEILAALMKLLKPNNEDTEDVFYNAGVIDAIKEIKNYF